VTSAPIASSDALSLLELQVPRISSTIDYQYQIWTVISSKAYSTGHSPKAQKNWANSHLSGLVRLAMQLQRLHRCLLDNCRRISQSSSLNLQQTFLQKYDTPRFSGPIHCQSQCDVIVRTNFLRVIHRHHNLATMQS
jgi:hypothetical protein